jgi:hypothetical protein
MGGRVADQKQPLVGAALPGVLGGRRRPRGAGSLASATAQGSCSQRRGSNATSRSAQIRAATSAIGSFRGARRCRRVQSRPAIRREPLFEGLDFGAGAACEDFGLDRGHGHRALALGRALGLVRAAGVQQFAGSDAASKARPMRPPRGRIQPLKQGVGEAHRARGPRQTRREPIGRRPGPAAPGTTAWVWALIWAPKSRAMPTAASPSSSRRYRAVGVSSSGAARPAREGGSSSYGSCVPPRRGGFPGLHSVAAYLLVVRLGPGQGEPAGCRLYRPWCKATSAGAKPEGKRG